MDPILEAQRLLTRRQLFAQGATGIGAVALASLVDETSANRSSQPAAPAKSAGGLPELPHFAPRAKNVIYLFQNGAPTHVDLFDYKPRLAELHGTPVPMSYLQNKRFSTMTGDPTGKKMLAPLEPFARHGESGAWASELIPYTAAISDDLCYIKSMYTEAVNHSPAISFFLSGAEMPGRPTMGAWLTYGLGTETRDLPGFVVMTSISKGSTCGQIFYDYYWESGFLPSRFQGVQFRGAKDPVLYLSNPDGMSREVRRALLDDLARLNQINLERLGDPEIETRIAQYEMGYRMQASVPELTDLSQEPKHVIDMYGPQAREPGTYAYNCLMARRLVERGVRFVQIMHAGWDQHSSLTTELYTQCSDTDQPSAALVKDLKQRGLLDDTLVIWGGEFGRTPFLQGDMSNRPRWGRDHHPYAFTLWMAGGGAKPGLSYGSSDDLGINVAENPVHVHDFQATVMHLLGIDHERLTYFFQGRHFRLTDVHGHVVEDLVS
ncbi:MAG: DUF1501 domain-containing protein [Planctomycetota bacterium]|nr:MAG: DUF1501 domain-containing protein [Planctomycetota bacterium]REJ86960.1 MAG: DUF1501 domain-containing protein [Planctomycetota bacterium]REK24912.1 MAG: DUF1501 domain-containing protein [Planctomycetota bacterium]REK48501.1 MAG: DUF1501 domain-containing protein [Planctomycetota bacterium]